VSRKQMHFSQSLRNGHKSVVVARSTMSLIDETYGGLGGLELKQIFDAVFLHWLKMHVQIQDGQQSNEILFHIDLLPVPIHLSFCVLLEILYLLLEKEAACHSTNDTLLLPPNNLIDPPPLHYRNKKCNSTARPKIDARKISFRA